MKRCIFAVIVAAVCSAIAAGSFTARPGEGLLRSEKFMIGTDGMSLQTGAFTYGNIPSLSFASFMTDPYADVFGLGSASSFGVSGEERAASLKYGPFSVMGALGVNPLLSLSYENKYVDVALMWKRREPKKPDLMTDWSDRGMKDILAGAVSAGFPPWIRVTGALSWSPDAGHGSLVRLDTELGPVSFGVIWGGTLGQRSKWRSGMEVTMERPRFAVWWRERYAGSPGYSGELRPFSTDAGWRMTLGGFTVGAKRRLQFMKDGERRVHGELFFESEKVDLSLAGGLRVGCRVRGRRLVLGVTEGGAFMELRVVPGRLVIFSEKGKIGFEITVEFPDEGV